MKFFSNQKNVGWAVAALGLVLFVAACKKEYIQNVNPVCFEQEVLPIFQSNCTQSGCHNSSSRQSGYDFSNYEGIMRAVKPGDYKGSTVYHITTTPFGIMPPSPYNRLSDEQITTIALWIDQGANNLPCQVTACDTTNVTFSSSVMPLLDTYCNGCHGGSAPSGDINLTNYSGVKASADNGKLLGSVKWASGYVAMPQGSNKLSSCNIAKIEKWIVSGAKND